MIEPNQEGLEDLEGPTELERTQPTEEILRALQQLQNSTAISPIATQPNSQEQDAPPDPPPLSEWEQLRAQLREKPVDADAWLRLVDLAEESGDMQQIKDTYEGLLETYPNTVSSETRPFLHHEPRLTRLLAVVRPVSISEALPRRPVPVQLRGGAVQTVPPEELAVGGAAQSLSRIHKVACVRSQSCASTEQGVQESHHGSQRAGDHSKML